MWLLQLMTLIALFCLPHRARASREGPPPDRRAPASRARNLGLHDLGDQLDRQGLSATQRKKLNEELDRVGDMLAVELSDEGSSAAEAAYATGSAQLGLAPMRAPREAMSFTVNGGDVSQCILAKEQGGTYEIQAGAEPEDFERVFWGADHVQYIEDLVERGEWTGVYQVDVGAETFTYFVVEDELSPEAKRALGQVYDLLLGLAREGKGSEESTEPEDQELPSS